MPAGDLIRRLDLADAYRARHDLGAWEDFWSRSVASGHVTTSQVEVEALRRLAIAGCRIEVEIEIERLRLRATAESSQHFTVDVDGVWTDAVVDDAAAKVAPEVAAGNDLARLLTVVRESIAAVTITVLHLSTEFAWVRSVDALIHEFDRSGWLEFSRLVGPHASRTRRVVVLEAGEESLCSRGLLVHGPDVWPATRTWTDSYSEVRDLRPDAREGAPSPESLLPLESKGGQLGRIDEVLRATAGALSWLSLADVATVNDDRVTIRFEGNRPLVTDLPPSPPGDAAPSVALWRWVVAAAQPGRRHAAIQAITLQAERATDLYRRAGSILDTAEFLFSISQSGLVQEALVARRAGRDAAVAAGRAAADRVRSTARATVDRTLVVIAAGVGVVLANKGELIDRSDAIALLGLAAALVVGAALLAFHFELPGAVRTIASFDRELDEHSEVLAPKDVDAIRRLPSLLDGSAEITRARRVTAAIIAVAVLALGGLALVVVPRPDGTGRSPSTTTTQTPTTNRSSTPPTSTPSTVSSP
jgi:hypothetical protein